MQHYAIVAFPKVDIELIQTFRKKYDPLWNVIHPHITLVFPFSDIPEQLILEHLETVSKTLKPFQIQLKDFTKSFDHYLFLLVQEGKEEIYKVHDLLYTGVLASQLRNDIPFLPHMTLGKFAKDNIFEEQLYNKALKEIQALHLNIDTVFSNFSLIQGDGILPAKIIKTFELKS
ncbi:MAG TPA: 2'-5' RNA ligase family protein [Patescibacteria group bacterium]